jgi:hypothetical protein
VRQEGIDAAEVAALVGGIAGHPGQELQAGVVGSASACCQPALENHSVVGGLAESVASTLAFAGAGTRIVPIALPDEFLAAGALPTLHDRYGLSTDSIVARVKAELTGTPEVR